MEDENTSESIIESDDSSYSKSEEYPHIKTRLGPSFQTIVPEFDNAQAKSYMENKKISELIWNPDKVNPEDLEAFVSLFPPDQLEYVYEVINACDYDLDKAFKQVRVKHSLDL